MKLVVINGKYGQVLINSEKIAFITTADDNAEGGCYINFSGNDGDFVYVKESLASVKLAITHLAY